MIGAQGWSSAQLSVTLSFGQAAFYGLVKAAGAGFGHLSIMLDFGLKMPVRVWTDSSAAIGISTRSGLGKLRHLEIHTLWVQETQIDLFTKHLAARDKIDQLVQLFGCEYRSGRSEAAPLLRPQGSSGGQGGQPTTGYLPAFVVLPDGEEDHQDPHDLSVLPHLYGQRDRDRVFPVILAPPRGTNDDDLESRERGGT